MVVGLVGSAYESKSGDTCNCDSLDGLTDYAVCMMANIQAGYNVPCQIPTKIEPLRRSRVAFFMETTFLLRFILNCKKSFRMVDLLKLKLHVKLLED